MTIENKFEAASRLKLKFPYKGTQRVEDLWDLDVTELDAIYKTLNAQVKQASEESLLQTKTKENRILELQIDIIKHIVKVKQEEKANREQEKELKTQKAVLLKLKAEKEQEQLKSQSTEQIDKLLKEIEEKEKQMKGQIL